MTAIRNVAIIAHVDHGKTTLVDKLLHAGNLFHERETTGELILDNNDLERERGITILSKNVSIRYRDVKINLIDTPGHSDFGGEVERVLNMADGVLLLVDAFEGPMPQTRFVLSKSLELGLKPIVVVNKVDKPNCKPDEAYEAVFDLMFALDATEEQLDFPVVYGSAKNGWMGPDWKTPTADVTYALDQIIEHVPPPSVEEGPLQMMITSLAYSNYTGRMASGRLNRGRLQPNQAVALIDREGAVAKQRTKKIFVYEGLGRVEVDAVEAGDICAISGLEGFEIGDTVSDPEHVDQLPPIAVDEPTMSMTFVINDSPFFGQSGKFVTSRHLKERLEREIEQNLALRVEPTDRAEAFQVYGRGVLHLSVLIETMRREGYELQIGQPQVIIKETDDGKRLEPIEELYINVPDEYSGTVINAVTQRKGTMTDMRAEPERTFLTFEIPSRGIIGLRTQLITATAGELIMTHRFKEFAPWVGEIPKRINGSMIASETGKAIPFSLNNLQERGVLMVQPNEEIYEGQVVGENARPGDMVVNLTKAKKQTNIRSAGADDKLKLTPPRQFTLEEALEYIQPDEYVEVTPEAMRVRKILLKESDRKRAKNPALAGMKV